MSIWHYTPGVRLRAILDDRMIRLSVEDLPAGTLAAAWCTTRQTWEPTAAMGGPRHGEGRYRIAVAPEAAPYEWEAYQRLSHLPPKVAQALVRLAESMGSSSRDWRVSFSPIGLCHWRSIEIDLGAERWTALSLAEAVAWTEPVREKGCLVCHDTEEQKGAPWRYLPDPNTGEPRVVCAACDPGAPAEAPPGCAHGWR